jgi:hypothetical protein
MRRDNMTGLISLVREESAIMPDLGEIAVESRYTSGIIAASLYLLISNFMNSVYCEVDMDVG